MLLLFNFLSFNYIPMARQTRRKPNSETVTVDMLSGGRDEMNLAELPIAVLTNTAPEGVKTLIFRDTRGSLTVTGSDALGLPTAWDNDVIVALIQLTKQRNNFTHACVHFTRYEVLRLLGWPNEGKSYRRLDEALRRWVGVTLLYEGCWWDNRSRQYGDANMHILESVVILDGKAHLGGEEQQALPLSSFTWNKVFMESCQADNLKRLNIEAYFALGLPTSKRLYRFLDKRFYWRPDWVFDLKEIAFERVGLSRNYAHNVAKIREKLQPAIVELEGSGFLEPLTREQRYFKEGTAWKIRLLQRRPSLGLPDAQDPQKAEPPALVGDLVRQGVTRSVADELVQSHPAERIEHKLEVFDWLSEKKDKRIGLNPAGYLVKSIEKDYATPKGFTSRADRECQKAARRQKEEEHAATRRAQQAADAAERAKRERVAAYWASLTSEQQAELEAQADAQADAEQLAMETGPLKRMGRAIRREAYIRHLLDKRERAESGT